MKKIIGMVNPFEYNQTLFVFDDQTLIDQIEVSTSRLTFGLKGLIKKYEIEEVIFKGSKEYTMGLVKPSDFSKHVKITFL